MGAVRAQVARILSLDVDGSGFARLAGISDRWAPYRSWVALLLRIRREEKAGPAPRGRSVR